MGKLWERVSGNWTEIKQPWENINGTWTKVKAVWEKVDYVDRPLTPEEVQQEVNEKIDLLLQMQLSMQGVI